MDTKEIVEEEIARQAKFGREPSPEDFMEASYLAGYSDGYQEACDRVAEWYDSREKCR